jgi:nucleotide-binding universal stress UspA family protein
MFQKILVPLDGSHLAEAAIGPAVQVSRRLGNLPITLIHIIEKDAPQEIHGEKHLQNEEDAFRYLEEISQKIPEGIEVKTHVHTEVVQRIPRSIVEHAEELSQDLVVMCTHGRGGPKEWVVGSIAQQVIGLGETPVLLIRPESPENMSDLSRLLVAIDHDPEHGGGPALAMDYAQAAHASLHLLTIIPRPGHLRGEAVAAGRLSPVTTAALLDVQVESAAEDLRALAEECRGKGIAATVEVRRGNPPQEIAHAAEKHRAQIIVLGTHGRSGINALWAGSVAPQMPGITQIPLLFVPRH